MDKEKVFEDFKKAHKDSPLSCIYEKIEDKEGKEYIIIGIEKKSERNWYIYLEEDFYQFFKNKISEIVFANGTEKYKPLNLCYVLRLNEIYFAVDFTISNNEEIEIMNINHHITLQESKNIYPFLKHQNPSFDIILKSQLLENINEGDDFVTFKTVINEEIYLVTLVKKTIPDGNFFLYDIFVYDYVEFENCLIEYLENNKVENTPAKFPYDDFNYCIDFLRKDDLIEIIQQVAFEESLNIFRD